MPTGRVCTFFYYKTRFFWYSSIKGSFPASQKRLTLGSGRAPVFCSHRACRGHAHIPKIVHRTDVPALGSFSAKRGRSRVNLPAYRLSRSRIPLTPTCERLGMCRLNATKGIEHTDVSYKRPEGPPKPPLLQGQRWCPVGRWEPFRKDDLRWKQTVACSAEARKPSRFSWPHDRRRPPVGRGIDRSRPCSDGTPRR